MDKRQKYTLQTFRRVRDFMRRNAVEGNMARVDVHVDALAAVIDRLTVFSVEQDARTRLAKSGTTSVTRQLRQLRLEYMGPVSRFGQLLPGLENRDRIALSIPRKTDVEGTVTAALGMAAAADSRKAAFVAASFADDFTDRLRDVARELKATIDDRARDRGRRSASTEGVKDEIRQGKSVIRMLDAIVTPALEPNPSLLKEWRTLKRLIRSAVASTPPAPDVLVVEGGPGTPGATSAAGQAAGNSTQTPEVKAA